MGENHASNPELCGMCFGPSTDGCKPCLESRIIFFNHISFMIHFPGRWASSSGSTRQRARTRAMAHTAPARALSSRTRICSSTTGRPSTSWLTRAEPLRCHRPTAHRPGTVRLNVVVFLAKVLSAVVRDSICTLYKTRRHPCACWSGRYIGGQGRWEMTKWHDMIATKQAAGSKPVLLHNCHIGCGSNFAGPTLATKPQLKTSRGLRGFKMAPTSGFEICFAFGSQHLWCLRVPTKTRLESRIKKFQRHLIFRRSRHATRRTRHSSGISTRAATTPRWWTSCTACAPGVGADRWTGARV